MNNRINVVIPMAGRGQRFSSEGFTLPKPLIPVKGIPMIQKVIQNLDISNAQYVFIIQQAHQQEYNLGNTLQELVPACKVLITKTITDGPACTALLAAEYIDESPLMIINCDQVIGDFNIDNLLAFTALNNADGVLGAFISSSKKNSYMKLDPQGEVIEVKEKVVISNIATNGLHFWKNGKDFLTSSKEMIDANERYSNEFYIAPSYNHLVKKGKKILPFFYNLHVPIGTPEDLKFYEQYGNF